MLQLGAAVAETSHWMTCKETCAELYRNCISSMGKKIAHTPRQPC